MEEDEENEEETETNVIFFFFFFFFFHQFKKKISFKLDLTLRIHKASEKTQKGSIVNKFEDVKKESIILGYVLNLTKAGCFVSLAHNLYARAKVFFHFSFFIFFLYLYSNLNSNSPLKSQISPFQKQKKRNFSQLED